MEQLKAFANRIVLITGAGSGLGRALAAGFCADGAQVVGFGRCPAKLKETALSHGQGRMSWVAGDLGKADDIERLFREVTERYGRVDILVNNAALHPKMAFLDMAPGSWDEVIRVNVIGMSHCCHEALPGMLRRGYGRILNVGSFAWKSTTTNTTAYSASKAALSAFTRSLAAEIDRALFPDVLINELVPGPIRTGMSDHGGDPMDVYPYARLIASLPAGGPTGRIFLRGRIYEEESGRRSGIGRVWRQLKSWLRRGYNSRSP